MCVLLLKQTKTNGNGILLFFSGFFSLTIFTMLAFCVLILEVCYQEVDVQFIECNNQKVEMIT